MRIPALTLLTLATASSAYAQSSVTMFGVVDNAVSVYESTSFYYNRGAFTAVTPPDITKTQTALSNSAYNSSRLGFRGNEDLGGGLGAGFWLEAGIATDTGNGGGVGGAFNFYRRSTVSLTDVFGEVRLGRDYTPSYWNDAIFDPFNNNGVGASLIYNLGISLSTARGPGSALAVTDNYARTSNSVAYFLPSNSWGVYGQAMYAFDENTRTDSAPIPSSAKGRYAGGRLGYTDGRLDIAIGYGQSNAVDLTALGPAGLPTGVGSNEKIKTTNLGASYDFGPVKLFGELSRVVDDLQTRTALTGASDQDKYPGALIGVSIPVGVGLIRASYGRVKYQNDLPPLLTQLGLNLDSSANKIAVGYIYNLSKRTALYATAARINIQNGQNNPAIMGVTTGGSVSYVSVGNAMQGYAPRNATGYDFGLRHSF